MLKSKNMSPKELAFLTAIILALPVTVGAAILRNEWPLVALSFVFFVLLAYFVMLAMLQNFIYRRIKTIYKFIYQTKATKKEEMYHNYLLPQKSIDEVKEDVEVWAKQREVEIESLRKTEKFRKEFLQNLSHELKTPIFAVQSYIDTLLDGAIDSPDMAKKFLSKAANNAARLSALAKDLDEISKLESGVIPLHRETFFIHNLIREVYESLAYSARKSNIQTIFKKGTEHPYMVFADREKIRQVLTNLVDNAIKYSHPEDMIIASVYLTDGERVLVEITDQGQGIAEEHLPRVFERFYRTDLARSRRVGGSGLGLSICKHIVEAHNETIHIRSKIGVGTTVGFTLPLAKPD